MAQKYTLRGLASGFVLPRLEIKRPNSLGHILTQHVARRVDAGQHHGQYAGAGLRPVTSEVQTRKRRLIGQPARPTLPDAVGPAVAWSQSMQRDGHMLQISF